MNKVNDYSSKFEGESIVFVCVDTDSLQNPQQQARFNTIQTWSNHQGFKLIGFYEIINYMLLHQKLTQKEKIPQCDRFLRHINAFDMSTIAISSQKIKNS